MAPSRIWLIRHAESTWNAAGRWQGQANPPLSPLGHRQAELLATRLARLPLAALYTSDLDRCVQTAAPTAARTGLPAHRSRLLREIDVGAWSGLTRAQIEQQHPEEWASVLAGRDVRRGGGETTAELAARVRAFTAELTHHDHGDEVAVFTHGGWIREALRTWLPTFPTGTRLSIGNASVTELHRTPAGTRLLTLADRSHLDGLATTPQEPTPYPLRPAPTSGYTPDVV